MMEKKRISKNTTLKKKTRVAHGNLMNQEPTIWDENKKKRISKGWPSKNTKVQ